MNYQSYLKVFGQIIDSETRTLPYINPQYLNYAKLNFARMARWQKTLHLNQDLVNEVKRIEEPQKWIIIVEPWCGDAAPILPFLVRLAEQNSCIQYDIQLRDKEPYLINSYLTNGTKSIPKLVVRNETGNDLFTYGPRPKATQHLVDELKAAGVDYDTLNTEVQNWYNRDKGSELQKELLYLLMSHVLA